MAEYIDREDYCRNRCRCDAKRCIRAICPIWKAPKADVAPVRRGHWIDCEDDYTSYVRCSVCGDEYTYWEADCAHTDFCPGCGAKMDGGYDND